MKGWGCSRNYKCQIGCRHAESGLDGPKYHVTKLGRSEARICTASRSRSRPIGIARGLADGRWRASRRHAPLHATAHHSTRGRPAPWPCGRCRTGFYPTDMTTPPARARGRRGYRAGLMAGLDDRQQTTFLLGFNSSTVPRTHTTTLNAHSEWNDSLRPRCVVRPLLAPHLQGDMG